MEKSHGVVIVEGLIGVGKSTLTEALAAQLGGEFIAEPDEKTNPFLALYYQDPARWSYTMQSHLLSCRYRAHLYAQSRVLHGRDTWVCMDRSFFGDSCFARVQKKLGYFCDAEYESYFRMHKDYQTHILYPTVAIFLHATPETCAKRIDRRISEKEGRKCESGIDIGYLSMLDQEINVLEKELANRGVSVISLDWDGELDGDGIQKAAAELAARVQNCVPCEHETWTGIGGRGA